MFIAFNSTFGPLLVIGFLGMPRRVVTYAGYLQGANVWVSVSAFVLGFSMLIFLVNFIWSHVLRARAGRDEPVGVEVDRVAAAVAGPGAQLRPHPDLRPGSVSVRGRRAACRAAPGVAPARHDARDRARQPRDRLLGRRDASRRSVMARNAEGRPRDLLAARHGVLLLRVPVRVLLPPVAQLARPVASEARRPFADARHPDRAGDRRWRRLCSALGLADHRADRRPAWRVKGAIARWSLGSPPSCCRSSSGRRSGVRPDRWRVRQRVRRVDRAAGPLRARPPVLAGDDARDLLSLPGRAAPACRRRGLG